VLEPPQRDAQWLPQRSPAAPEYLGGEQPRGTMEMGAAPARPEAEPQPQAPAWQADSSRGIRILREVTPPPAPYVMAPPQQ
jgi:hypothetical protein